MTVSVSCAHKVLNTTMPFYTWLKIMKEKNITKTKKPAFLDIPYTKWAKKK